MRHKPIRTVALESDLEVPAAGTARKAQDALTTPWTLVVLGGVLLVAGVLSRGRRPPPSKRRRGVPTTEEPGPA
jgi:hypothetical protein